MKFSKRLNELVDQTISSSKGKTLKATFSRRFLDDLSAAMLNDNDYEVNTVTVKNSSPVRVSVKPVENFKRKFIVPILEKCGLDSDDREAFLENYKFTSSQASSLYELNNSIIYEYMKTGKNYKLMPTEDFVGSIYMRDIPDDILESKDGKKVKRKAHKGLCKRSSCPKWLKEIID